VESAPVVVNGLEGCILKCGSSAMSSCDVCTLK